MNIKRNIKWTLLGIGIFVVMCSAVGISWKINADTKNVKAQDIYSYHEGQATELSDYEGASDKSAESSTLHQETDVVISEHGTTLPSRYDARKKYSSVRTKNQNTEGLCWLYSAVTALEYNIAKNFEDYEVSVKHLDYLIIDGRYVYKQDDATNLYFDRYLSVQGAYHRTDLGTSGANEEVVYGLLNPLSVVSESDFTDVLKNNDSRLSVISRYEDLWDNSIISKEERDEILETNFEKEKAYMQKQNYDEVNDPSKVKYVVTGIKTSKYNFDNTRTSDDETVNTIKNLVNDYGAVKISTFGTGDRFEKCSDKKTVGGKTLYTFVVDGRKITETIDGEEVTTSCTANHGMTIVGWNDEWEYEYDGETRSGAFILQNSWGENVNNDWGENGEDESRWHLAYISAIPGMMYYDSVERYDDYDYYYGPSDYRDSDITPADDELIFELSLDKSEQLKALTFGTLSKSHSYDVYLSDSGKEEDFVKDGTFTAGAGVAKYEFSNDYDINGSYAVKLKRTDETTIASDSSRDRDTINTMAYKIWALRIDDVANMPRETCRVVSSSCTVSIPATTPSRASYRFLGYADTADAITPVYQPGDSITLSADKTIYAVWEKNSTDPSDPSDPEDDEELVVPNTAGTPETGDNVYHGGSSGTTTPYLSSAVIVVTAIGIFIRTKSKGHKKFER